MSKGKDEYYIKRTSSYNASCLKPIVGKHKMIKEFFKFLFDPSRINLEIQKINNYEIKDTQWFDKDYNLIDDVDGILVRDGKIDENGDLITEKYGKLTKIL